MAKKKSAKASTSQAGKVKGEDPFVAIGKSAPVFSLNNQGEQKIALKDFRGKWVVLYFYPKDDTSGCTKQACQFRDELPKFKKTQAVILGVSPDTEAKHQKFIKKYDLNFDLLADPEKKVLEKYGVWQQKSMYGRKYMGVVRTTYLINPDGKVAFRWDKVKVAGHDQVVLEKIKELA